MLIHRSATSQPPYTLTFERIKSDGLFESGVAANALSLNVPQQETFGLNNEAALFWAQLARRIAHKPDEETSYIELMTLHEIKTLGTALLHYSDRTNDDLSGQFAPSGIIAATRRVEGAIALNMANTISDRGIGIRRLELPKKYRFVPWNQPLPKQ